MNQNYKKESAGSIAINNVPLFYEDERIENARQAFLKNIKNYETINYVYVLNYQNILKGVLSIKIFLNQNVEGPFSLLMEKEIVKVSASSDREEVVFLSIKNNLKAIPVVDKDNKFIGVVPSDTIINILNQENIEDMFIKGGFLIDNSIKDIDNLSVKQLTLLRSPWLLAGLFGGIFAAKIIGSFESIITKFITLSFFIPVIVYISGAVSAQSATIFIRGVAINKKISINKYFIREIKVGIILGLILGIILSFVSYIGWNNFNLSIILFFSVFLGIIFSIIFSLLIPIFLWKIKKDPALGTGPLATIISDVLSVAVYLIIASIVFSILN